MRHGVGLKVLIVAASMLITAVLAHVFTPSIYLADQHARKRFSELIPKSFGEWVVDASVVPVPPSPDLQKVLDETYDETVALTYRNSKGQRVMLSLAYGRNQHKGMNTHRPEICYPAQGFKISQSSLEDRLAVNGRDIDVTRLVATMGPRVEPITYWLIVGDKITHFGYRQRMATVSYGLRGEIPDGVLVRVSSIDDNSNRAFAVQDDFIRALLASLKSEEVARLLGTSGSAG